MNFRLSFHLRIGPTSTPKPDIDGSSLRIAIVMSDPGDYPDKGKLLLDDATKALKDLGVKQGNIVFQRVPSCNDLPLAILKYVKLLAG